jgi:hypothetical protein
LFTCESAGLSALIFWVCLVVCVGSLLAESLPSLAILATFVGSMLLSGGLWLLREGVRRHWPIRWAYRRSWWRTTNLLLAPAYRRWMTDEELMIGRDDGWFRLPWQAIQRAVCSPQGIEFLVDREQKMNAWFVERGDRSDDQWQQVIARVAARIPNTRCFGSVRHAVGR